MNGCIELNVAQSLRTRSHYLAGPVYSGRTGSASESASGPAATRQMRRAPASQMMPVAGGKPIEGNRLGITIYRMNLD